MKKTIVASTLSFILVYCSAVKHLNGAFHHGNTMEFRFKENPNEFEYFLRSEMGILQYSTGNWTLNDGRLYLQGFSDNNLKVLKVESTIHDATNNNQTQIEVQCDKDNSTNYINKVLIVNANKIYSIAKDTTFIMNYRVENVQVKCYLSYTGILSSNPKIDTLSFSKINVSENGNKNKNVVLKFAVHAYDFARVKFVDTATVKNKNVFLLNQNKFIKQ